MLRDQVLRTDNSRKAWNRLDFLRSVNSNGNFEVIEGTNLNYSSRLRLVQRYGEDLGTRSSALHIGSVAPAVPVLVVISLLRFLMTSQSVCPLQSVD